VQALADRVAGLENIVLEELERRPVDLIGPRLRLEPYPPPTGLREFGVVVAGGDTGFRD
jgi:hypothetical protein